MEQLHVVSTFAYQLTLLALVLWAVMSLTRESRVISVLLFIVLPVVILPLILQTEWNGPFNLAKSLTMLFVGAYLTLMRLGLRSRPFTVVFGLLFLLNIVEAALQDLSSGNLLNVVAAVVVLAMLPTPRRLSVDGDDALVYPTSWCFILAYSIWNFCFLFAYDSVRGYRGDYALVAAVLLVLPILVAMRHGARRYTQARAYSLAFCITMTEATVLTVPEAWPLTGGSLYSPLSYRVVSVSTLVVVVGCWAVLWRRFPQQHRLTLLGALLGRLQRSEAGPMASPNAQGAS